MRVCLINPHDTVVEDACWDEPLGLLYLGAVLEENGVDVEVLDMNFHNDFKALENSDADLYGVYCSSPLIRSVLNVNSFLKETHPHAIRIVGGPHATCVPGDLVEHFDKVIIGEGEKAILEVLEGKFVGKLAQSPPIEDLDTIPFPARHLISTYDYHRRVGGLPSVGLITARGCPHHCAFCSEIWGNYVRFRSAGNVIAEVEECIDRYGIRAFSIRDDTFTLNRERLLEILSGFEELDIVWRCLTRVDQVDGGILGAMKDSGCTQIVYGIESGNQRILNNLGKGTTVKQTAEAIRLTMEAGIQTKTAVIVGSPGETWETVNDTISFIEENPPDEAIVCVFTPYPGSPVWRDPARFEMRILTRDVSLYAAVGPEMRGNVVVETEAMSSTEIADARDIMLTRFRELGLVPAKHSLEEGLKYASRM